MTHDDLARAQCDHARAGAALGSDEAVDNMVTYVRSLSGLVEADAAAHEHAANVHGALQCLSHGRRHGQPDARRAEPDATISGYTARRGRCRTTIVNGRNGVMPAHGELLGDNRTKILAAYVYSLAVELTPQRDSAKSIEARAVEP